MAEITAVSQQTKYIVNSINDQINAIADLLPHGNLYIAKNITGSTFYKLLNAFILEIQRVESIIKQTADEDYIFNAENLLVEWENALGIPDKCFKTQNITIENRQKQVIAKLALMNVQTTQDFINLAAFFDIEVEIVSGTAGATFTFTFPVVLAASQYAAAFTMIVKFNKESPSNVFPLTFPVTFANNDEDLIKCLFLQLAPANVYVMFVYTG